MAVATTRRARALAAAIRELRERSGMRSRELSLQLGLSHSTVSHWETGKRVPAVEDVASLLGAVGVNGDERERILNLARHATEGNWLTHGMPGVPEQLAGAMECERDANVITEWSPAIVPGLLQTRAYAQMTVSADGSLSAHEVESRVFVRMGRREFLSEGNPVRHLHALIGEAILHEPVGESGVLLEQLRYLHKMSQHSNVTLRIVRSGSGWHPGLHGPFIYYEFPDSEPVVHFEHYSSGAFIQDDKDVNAYRYVIDAIREKAADKKTSSRLVADTVEEMERRA